MARPKPAFSFDLTLTQFAVPASTYLASHPSSPPFQGIATGALIFAPDGQLLLVQRAPTDSSPDLWEIPGGGVDPADATILHGVAREVLEESGLTVTHFKRSVPAAGEGAPLGRAFVTSRGVRVVRFEFEVEVRGGEEVKLDESEHQRFAWVREEECRAKMLKEGSRFEFTGRAQQESILEGFRLRKEGV
ncbi:hypothetical protein QTJ16_004507 [Diplocarpon rosae]|uniref:Nudix hydrolase domain-containing protein n=1 Tax=Diplocarpon rosae TaxID=946125 RepID=A0AAD9SZ32_9HELO|nr:hypothetical protein QTJ16_004507 [Diplocarpon rosae]